jgi:hypothetical protein
MYSNIDMQSHDLYNVQNIYATDLRGHNIFDAYGNHIFNFNESYGTNYRNWDWTGKNLVGANIISTSDRDKKKNIELYKTSALDEICTTPVYTYHMEDDLDNEMKRIGIILQEAPVDTVDIKGKGIDLYQMVTMCWKAIQELKEENNNLKLELEEFKKVVK